MCHSTSAIFWTKGVPCDLTVPILQPSCFSWRYFTNSFFRWSRLFVVVSEYLQLRKVDISCCNTHDSESVEYSSRSTYGLSHATPFSTSLQDKKEVRTYQIPTHHQQSVTEGFAVSLPFSTIPPCTQAVSHGGLCQASTNPLHHYHPLGSRTRVARCTIHLPK